MSNDVAVERSARIKCNNDGARIKYKNDATLQ